MKQNIRDLSLVVALAVMAITIVMARDYFDERPAVIVNGRQVKFDPSDKELSIELRSNSVDVVRLNGIRVILSGKFDVVNDSGPALAVESVNGGSLKMVGNPSSKVGSPSEPNPELRATIHFDAPLIDNGHPFAER